MRAWQVTGQGEPHEVMRMASADLPSGPLGNGELKIRVRGAALGFPDVLMCRGIYPLMPALPFTPGQEFFGEVTAAGAGTTTPVGTRLMGITAFMVGHGSFAEECTTQESMTFPVPEGMPAQEAAGFTIQFHTAYIGLKRRARLAAGETLLVTGAAGGTGAAAIQMGKALGARVIAAAGGPDKAAACRSMGADLAIDYFAEDFAAAVNAATDGRGADVVFDPVGGETFEKSVDCLAMEGRILPIGFACGKWGTVSPELFAFKNASLVGAIAGMFPRQDMLAMHDEILTLHAAGKLELFLDRVIGFEGIGQSLQDLADRKVRGRVVATF
jgi:NADPH2:quinone reductase